MLNELRKYISSILFEGRKEDIQAQHPEIDVEFLSKNDPTKNLKYLHWMAKQQEEGNDPEEIVELVREFDKNIQRIPGKNIDSYTMETLSKQLEAFKGPSKRKEVAIAKEGGKKIYEDDDVMVYHIMTPQASMLYGKNTTWCISSSDFNKTMKNWKNYVSDLVRNIEFYFIIRKFPKGNNFDKVAVNYHTDITEPPIFTDALDVQQNGKVLKNAIPNFSKIVEFIKEYTFERPDMTKNIHGKFGKNKNEFIELLKSEVNNLSKSELEHVIEQTVKQEDLWENFNDFVSTIEPGNLKQKIWYAIPFDQRSNFAQSFLDGSDNDYVKYAKDELLIGKLNSFNL